MIRIHSLPLAAVCSLGCVALSAWAVSTPIADWKIAGPFGGTATTVAVDPQNPKTVLAGAMSSLLYQSQDFGATWTPLDLPKRTLGEVTSVLVDPSDSNHYVVGMLDAFGGGLYNSHDGGKTWEISKELGHTGVRALAAAPSLPSKFVAGTLAGVMVSTDSGATWSRISDLNNLEMQGITAVAIDPKDPNVIYAGTPHLPWKTSDGGKTWESIHSGMIDDSDVFSIYVDPATPTNIFASACSGIYSSLNRGDAWRKLAGIPNTSRRTHVIREDPAQPNTVYAGTTMGLFKSTNGGVTWKTLTTTQVNALAFDPTQPTHLYAAMDYEGIGKSENSGELIKPTNQGFVDRQISSLSISGNRLVSIETQEGESTGIFLSADKGETWAQLNNIRGLGGVHMRNLVGSRKEERLMLGATQRRLFKSLDSGMSWKEVPLRMTVVQPAPVVPATRTARKGTAAARTAARRPAKPRTILRTVNPSEIAGLYSLTGPKGEFVFAATNLGLFRTANMGDDWTLISIEGVTGVQGLFAPAVSDGRLIARTSDGLVGSDDGGDHWAKLDFPLPVADVNEVAMPAKPEDPILIATRVGVYRSEDAGKTWTTNKTGEMQGSTVTSIIYGAGSDAFATAYGELFQSKDCGKSWTAVPTALHSLTMRQLWKTDVASNRLYAITSGLGILFREEGQ
jgi:photosystem II stability/assembly factor-like uncharacterized protein